MLRDVEALSDDEVVEDTRVVADREEVVPSSGGVVGLKRKPSAYKQLTALELRRRLRHVVDSRCPCSAKRRARRTSCFLPFCEQASFDRLCALRAEPFGMHKADADRRVF